MTSTSRPVWPGWRHLPRDARDTLFLLAVIGWTILPHAAHLAPWCLALSGLMLFWRAYLALANAPLPRRRAIAGVLLIAIMLTLWTERTLLGKEAGVTMLVVLMSLKTLELRARRDAIVVFFLGFFLVLTNFLYSQSLPTAFAMLLSAWGLLTALVLAHMPAGRPPLFRAGAVAARAALFGAPLMVALFVLFPRIAPLWGVPHDAMARTGLSGSMRLGDVAELAADDAVAFRIRFLGRVPPPEAMYFRGPVLAAFDGREWTRLPDPPGLAARSNVQLFGTPVRYEVTLEPSRLAVLPLLELTPAMPGAAPRPEGLAAVQRADLQWQTERPVTSRLRFEASAWLQHRVGATTPPPDADLALPADRNPRTLRWAAELRRRPDLAEADAHTLAQALLEHIHGGGYIYTLEPGPYGDDAVDEFWLDRRAGFCEHFAAAFVVLMRAMGVPARVVTGYQGTDRDPVDGYYVVRQSAAHAWAEYWQQGAGWVRADPTAAVAPDRIVRGSNLVPRPGLVAGTIGSVNPALLAELRRLIEVANNRWNQWVLNYSSTQQFNLLERFGVDTPSWADLAYALIGLLCLGSLAGAGWALWDRQRQDPWQRLQQRIALRLARLGVHVEPHQGPRARAAAVRRYLGTAGEPLAAALEAIDQARYARAGRVRIERDWHRRVDAAAAALRRG